MSDSQIVLPTRDDPVAASASEVVGGPAGRRVTSGSGWWTAVRVALAMTAVACALGFLQKVPCRQDFFAENVYPRLCYTDIAPLYDGRGFAAGALPYVDTGDWEPLEYPVLTGAFMTLAAVLTQVVDTPGVPAYVRFFDVNVVLLAACALLGCWFVAGTHRHRPWDAVLLAPGIVLTAYINWDLLAVALLAGALWAWARDRPVLTGVLLGLGTAAKLYPILLLGPLLLLCLRGGRQHAFLRVLLGAAWTWLAVNLPLLLVAPDGWAAFYSFSRSRPAGFGSPWYALDQLGHPVPPAHLNLVAGGLFVLACAGIAVLAFAAPHRPRVAQLLFLVVAAFVLTNKVYSPQYVLWLVFLFPLARPRWRAYLVWLAFETVYFVAVWWYLQGLTNPGLEIPGWPHVWATFLRMAATLVICALVIRDVWRPEHDPVREVDPVTGALIVDDPGGGVLVGAPDRWRLGGPGRSAAPIPLIKDG
ncbi:MAG TPA: glycosyltransferase 87 family protein [Candidatus Limnocylindria bacterium]|nr:glycosyltransferase 87 family protein [Candidatus Limnocylindria bacterium]